MAETNGTHNEPEFPDDVIAVYMGHGSRHLIKGRVHVLILNDDGSWFAHGIEADYSAEGTSLEDVRKRFEEGFGATVRAYFKRDGNIFGAFRPAPDEYMKLYNEQARQWCYTFKKKLALDIAPKRDPSLVEFQVVSKEEIPTPAEHESKVELDLEFSTASVPAGCAN